MRAKRRRLEESRERFESAWRELGEVVEQSTGFTPRPAGLGLLVLGVSAGLALTVGGRALWSEVRRGGSRGRVGDGSEVAGR